MPWTQLANIKGPKGDQGNIGPAGPPGEDGAGVAIAGQVNTYGDLPTGLTADDAGDGYLVDADGLLYVWSGTAFPANGAGVEFRGPQGIQGPPGDTGATGTTGARGSLWYTGSGAPTSVPGSQANDLYLDTASGDIYQLS